MLSCMRPLLLAGCVLVLGCSGSAPDDDSKGVTTTGGAATNGGSGNQGGAHASASTIGDAGSAGMTTPSGGVSGVSGGGGASSTGGANGSGGLNGKAGAAGMAGNAGSAPTGTGTIPSDPYGDARIRCVDRTNALRATKGLGPIPRLAKAEPCVDGQAKADSESGKPHSAFNACLDQVKWKAAAQNECPGYGSVEDTLTKCLDMMWAEGPGGGHYDAMVGGSTHTACGIYTTPAGKVWLVEDFWTE